MQRLQTAVKISIMTIDNLEDDAKQLNAVLAHAFRGGKAEVVGEAIVITGCGSNGTQRLEVDDSLVTFLDTLRVFDQKQVQNFAL